MIAELSVPRKKYLIPASAERRSFLKIPAST